MQWFNESWQLINALILACMWASLCMCDEKFNAYDCDNIRLT